MKVANKLLRAARLCILNQSNRSNVLLTKFKYLSKKFYLLFVAVRINCVMKIALVFCKDMICN